MTGYTKGPFTVRTSMHVDHPTSTSVDMRERTHVDARHRTLTDTYNICKCYRLMLYVNDIQRYYLRHLNAN